MTPTSDSFSEDRDITYELFDPLGVRTSLISSLTEKGVFSEDSIVFFNESAVQHKDSNLCGQFCVTFLTERLENPDISFSDLINQIFSSNLQNNDTVVKEYIKELNHDAEHQ